MSTVGAQPEVLPRPRHSFPRGEKNPRWRGGKAKNEHGYVRIWAGENRGKYEHRVVVDQLMQIFPGRGLRKDEEVDHIDGNRAHNCPGNLLVLQDVIHHAISNRGGRCRWSKGNGVRWKK